MLVFRGCDPVPYRSVSSLPVLVVKAAFRWHRQGSHRPCGAVASKRAVGYTKIDCGFFRTVFSRRHGIIFDPCYEIWAYLAKNDAGVCGIIESGAGPRPHMFASAGLWQFNCTPSIMKSF